MSAKDKLDAVYDQMDFCGAAKPYPIKDVVNFFKDSEVNLSSQAESYLLRAMGIPKSYFNNSISSHQIEVLDNALRTHVDEVFNAVVVENKVVIAGPVTKIDFNGLKSQIKRLSEEPVRVIGDLLEGQVSISFMIEEFKTTRKYAMGYEVQIPVLFYRPFRVSPCFIEEICSNGLIDWRSDQEHMILKSDVISVDSIQYGMAAVKSVLATKREAYMESINFLASISAPSVKEVSKLMQRERLPKGLIDKTLTYIDLVSTKQVKDEPLPVEYSSLEDLSSIMTYSASKFNVKTRLSMESKILDFLSAEFK